MYYKHIHILGAGGVGFWLSVGLARMVPLEELTTWDEDDLLNGHGHERLPKALPATKKVRLLQGFLLTAIGVEGLLNVRDELFYPPFPITTLKDTLVVDCTDMSPIRRKRMWISAQVSGATMLRISYDGLGGTVACSSGLPLRSKQEGGYAAIPSFGLSLAAGGLGAEFVARVYHGKLALPCDLLWALEKIVITPKSTIVPTDLGLIT